jgi:hypothetical protein
MNRTATITGSLRGYRGRDQGVAAATPYRSMGRSKLPLCPDQKADERSDVGATGRPGTRNLAPLVPREITALQQQRPTKSW